MSHTVVGLFNNRNAAQAAKQELIQRGFTDEDIDVSHRATTTGANSGETSTTQIEITDSVGNFFASLFGDNDTTARNYASAAGDADAIVTVHADSVEKARQAAEILDSKGAIDIDAASSQQNQRNVTETTQTTPQTDTYAAETANNAARVEGDMTIPVIEEQLQVGKREVEGGTVRVRSRIIEKPVQASVRLREEHVIVNRHPVNRAVSEADMSNVSEGDLQITERAEVPVVAKEARVVEEVTVGKNVTEREETVRDTVRSTEVEVEKINTETTARRADNKS